MYPTLNLCYYSMLIAQLFSTFAELLCRFYSKSRYYSRSRISRGNYCRTSNYTLFSLLRVGRILTEYQGSPTHQYNVWNLRGILPYRRTPRPCFVSQSISTHLLPLHLPTNKYEPPHSPQSQNSSNSFYVSPSRTSGMATIQPPEQVANIREGPFSSAPPSGMIFSANQLERLYLQPPTWNNPRPETSQLRNSYENPPQYRETLQTNCNLLHLTRLHLGELGY